MTKLYSFFLLQMCKEHIKLELGSLSVLCILVSISSCSILCSYFSTVPYIKKNILTRLDELLIQNFTFFVCFQCSVCLISLIQQERNDYLYLAFYIILYGSLVNIMGIGIGLSLSRVLIIVWVSYTFPG